MRRNGRTVSPTRARAEALEGRVLLAATLVKDLNTDTLSSAPADFFDLNGTTFFTADDGVRGRELWKTDGTAGGTALVKDISPGAGNAFQPNAHREIVSLDGRLFFFADDGVRGRELWSSDGTAGGTAIVADLAPGAASSWAYDLQVLGDRVFFIGGSPGQGVGLYVSDGTAAGTRRVMQTFTSDSTHGYSRLVAWGSDVAFVAYDASPDGEVWVSDGTAANTRRLTDFATNGPDSSTEFAVLGDSLYFGAYGPGIGGALYKISPAGVTSLVRDANPNGYERVDNLHAVNGRLYFQTFSDTTVFGSDGTGPGTVALSPAIERATGYLPFNGSVYFMGATDAGWDLYKTDGTPGGTTMAVDLPGTERSGGHVLLNLGGALHFFHHAGDYDNGTASGLYRSDGTAAGTKLVKAGVLPHNLPVVSRDQILFATGYAAHGLEPWSSDGTPAGTAMLKDVNTVTGTGAYDMLGTVNGRAVFTSLGGLWASDGTAAGTAKIKAASIVEHTTHGARTITLGRYLYFTAYADGTGENLWRTDGTSAGTTQVTDTVPGSADDEAPRLVAAFNGDLYFTMDVHTLYKVSANGGPVQRVLQTRWGDVGEALVVGDAMYVLGDTGGPDTVPELNKIDAANPNGVVVSNVRSPGSLTAVGDLLYFFAFDDANGARIWKSDGTAAGTVPVSQAVTPNRYALTASNGALYYLGVVASRWQLFRFDPASGQVTQLSNVQGTGAQPWRPAVVGSRLIFSPGDGKAWGSDGTPAGTQPLGSAALYGDSNSGRRRFPVVDGRAYFASASGLWETDGTPAGTRAVAGGPFYYPDLSASQAGRVFFIADDGRHGRELFVVDPVQTPYRGAPFAVGTTAATIQAEDFDRGGEGVAYHDLTPAQNTGGAYRTAEGVDLKTTTDAGGGYRLSDAAAGEWLEYTIDVAAAGGYRLEFRAGVSGTGGAFHAEVDGVDVTGRLAVPDTGGYDAMRTIAAPAAVLLAAGRHVLRLAMDANAGGGSAVAGFNWLRVSPATVAPATRRAARDAYVRGGTTYGGTNYGAASELVVRRASTAGSTRETYLHFAVSDLAAASLGSVKLRLFGRSSSSTQSVGVALFGGGTAAWTESGITWNNRPASDATALGTRTVSGTGGAWHEFDVTAYVKARRQAGATGVTFVLKGTATTDAQAAFASDEHTTSASRPQLVVG